MPSGSTVDVINFSIVLGRKVTGRPSSQPRTRATSADRGVWFVQRAAETHSHLMYVTISRPILSIVLLVGTLSSSKDRDGDGDLTRGDTVVKAFDKDPSNKTRDSMMDTVRRDDAPIIFLCILLLFDLLNSFESTRDSRSMMKIEDDVVCKVVVQSSGNQMDPHFGR
jgi:hypothetical protein